MTTAFGDYDLSYPPEILRGYVAPVPATGATAGAPGTYEPAGAITPADLAALADVVATPATAWDPSEYVPLADGTAARWDGAAWVAVVPAGSPRALSTTFAVAAGEPGTYDPEVAPADRPRNVTELRERAHPADPAPWPAGGYVLVGTSGKRAHWSGDEWRGGESPGYEPSPAAANDASPAAEDDETDDEPTEGGSDPA